jgi:hypothetical protein
MANSAGACPHCSERLDIGTHGLFLSEAKRPVREWKQARWKTCPKCSELEGVHVFLPFPSAFGDTGLRKLNGQIVPQARCTFHRKPGQSSMRDPSLAGLACSEGGPRILHQSKDEPEWTADELAEPHDCPGCGLMIFADDFCDDKCRETYLERVAIDPSEDGPDPELVAARLKDGIARRQAGDEPEAEEGTETRRLVVHRSRESRLREAKLLQARQEGDGRLRCEVPGCGFDFKETYGALGEGYAHVHHVEALAGRKAPSKTRLSELAVVCANCHAMIHRGGENRDPVGLISNSGRRRRT